MDQVFIQSTSLYQSARDYIKRVLNWWTTRAAHAEDLMVIALSLGEPLLKVGATEVKVEKNLLHTNM